MANCITLAERKSSRANSPQNFYPLNDPEHIEALVYGFGTPPEPVLSDVRRLWWRLRAHGIRLPAERDVIVIEGRWP